MLSKFNLKKMDSFEADHNELKFQQIFFEALKNMNPDDFEFVEKALEKDPKKNSLGPLDKRRRSNMVNYKGEFPLYLASKYNHIRTIELLHKCKRDLSLDFWSFSRSFNFI